jgi:hypothetical protein
MRLTVFEVKVCLYLWFLRDGCSRAPKSTLVVTPSSLLPQWVSEIEKHAPSLKVFVFDGWTQIRKQVALTPLDRKAIEAKKQKKAKKKPLKKKAKGVDDEVEDEDDFIGKPAKGKGKRKGTRPIFEEVQSEDEGYDPQTDGPMDDWARFCNEYDIVITSYTTLGKELGVARGSSERPRRWGVKYGDENKPRSPLVGVEWARVIMDEVQMAGGHQTVQMVSLLPRQYSFAVSGTPARGEVDDLRHVLESVFSSRSALYGPDFPFQVPPLSICDLVNQGLEEPARTCVSRNFSSCLQQTDCPNLQEPSHRRIHVAEADSVRRSYCAWKS